MGERSSERVLSDEQPVLSDEHLQMNNDVPMKIILIGAGRLATHLGSALHRAGHDILQVYSRTQASASALADKFGSEAVTDLHLLKDDAEVYIFSVKDQVLGDLIPQVCKGREQALFVHTAGSMPMDIFRDAARRYGVLYPMQTFSKERALDFSIIPCFVEGSDEATLRTVTLLAESVSTRVMTLTTDRRRYLHLAAVFACNFANHCYHLAEDILAQHDIPFDMMLPLIDETAAKVHELSPEKAQTGPAVRYDENVIHRQLQLLDGDDLLQDVYRLMSQSIHQTATKQ